MRTVELTGNQRRLATELGIDPVVVSQEQISESILRRMILERQLKARGLEVGIQVKNCFERRNRTYYIETIDLEAGIATLRSFSHYRYWGTVIMSPRLTTLLKKFVVVKPEAEQVFPKESAFTLPAREPLRHSRSYEAKEAAMRRNWLSR